MDLYVFNKDLDMIGLIDTYDSLIWTERYYTYGDFELELAPSEEALSVLQQDYYLWTPDAVENVSAGVTRRKLMIIETIEIETDPESGNKLIISGRSLESILDRRIVWKQTELDSTLQYAIKRLLNENAISPTSDTGGDTRKISNLIFEDSTDSHILALNVSAQFTGDNLYEAISTICSDNNIGFRITMNDNKQFVFKLYAGADRTYDQTENPYVCFSPSFNNLVNTNYQTSKTAFKNATRIGGEGEGNDRVFAVKYLEDRETSGLERRETFTDARSVSTKSYDAAGNEKTLTASEYQAVLQEKGSEKLLDNIMVEEFEAEINSTNQYKPERDFFLGDTVQIVNDYGIQGVALITEMIRSLDNTGYSIYPAFTIIESFNDLYEEVDFLFSDGAQYIDTEYKHQTNTWIDTKFRALNMSTYNSFYGGATSDNSSDSFTWGWNSGGGINADLSTVNPNPVGGTAGKIILGQQHTFKAGGAGCYIDGTYYEIGATIATSNITDGLFNRHLSGNWTNEPSRIVMYKTKVYEGTLNDLANSVLVRDFVPVKRKADNKPGLYDFCGKKFYVNLGTGEFIYQPWYELYDEIEYIQSNGTQYINTGVGTNQDFRVVMELMQPSSSGGLVMGTAWDANAVLLHTNGSNVYTAYWGQPGVSVPHNISTKYKMDYSRGLLKVDDETTYNLGTSPSNWGTCLLFGGANNSITRMYYCKLYYGSNIVRDYVPVTRKTDSKPGFYDKVTETFYTNSGSGEFIIPDNFSKNYDELEYIESSGTQWIDSGVRATSDITRIEAHLNLLNNASGARLFSGTYNGSSYALYLGYIGGNGNWWSYYLTSSIETPIPATVGEHTIVYTNNGTNQTFTYDETTTTTNITTGFDTGVNMPIFAYNTAGSISLYTLAKLYSYKLWNKNVLVRDFVPCKRKSDDKPGLYDKVTDVFYTNAGSGEFIIPT